MLSFKHLRIQDEDANYKESEYNRLRGNDAWIGRMVEKDFGVHGKFTGRVDGVDDHAESNGHRIFHITYSDGDEEWIEVDELAHILLPPSYTSVR